MSKLVIWLFEKTEYLREFIVIDNKKKARFFGIGAFLLLVLCYICVLLGYNGGIEFCGLGVIIFLACCTFMELSEHIHSVRKLLNFLILKVFIISYFLFVSFLFAVNSLIPIPNNTVGVLFLYISTITIYAILWLICSLIADSNVSKISNSLFSALLGTLTAILNIALIALPEKLYFGINFISLSLVRLSINMFLLPYVLISVSTIPIVNLRDYWKEKYLNN